MTGSRRAFVVVLDACGAGALPDAAEYGDAGASTLEHLAEATGGLELPTLGALGLGCVVPLRGVPPSAHPALHGRLAPRGPGKDSTTGHWELMGVAAPAPLPTYPGGFPAAIVAEIERATGRAVLCNRPANGIEAIEAFGARQRASGALIVYTSQDSVLQVAAHEDAIPRAELYAACDVIRELMRGEHAVGRVIARPFTGADGAFERTAGRRDLSVRPPARSHLELVQAAGIPVHAVGKVADLFAGVGIDTAHEAHDNAGAFEHMDALVAGLDAGLVYCNLVETDQVYGHRKDVAGFHAALRAIDTAVAGWLEELAPARDLLVLCADHGCDPTTPGTDHTREYVPLLAAFADHRGARHDGPMADVGASAASWLGVDPAGVPGTPFVPPA